MRLTLNEVKKRIEKMIPKGLDYEIDVEAGSIAIITHTPREFGKGGGESLTVKIAKSIKRRVVIRPHRDLLLNEDQVEQKIMETIPNEAQVRNIFIDPALSEVTIECDDPSIAVGHKGTIIQALRDEIGWLVNVTRAPAFESRTQHDIRRYRREMADERRGLLRKFGTRIYRPKRPGQPWARITALGSYREVGRAMHLVTTNESKVLVDVGAKPTVNKNEVQPFFNAPELLSLIHI